jgi:RNA polymerase sigma-70 factor (ECF subfamily)
MSAALLERPQAAATFARVTAPAKTHVLDPESRAWIADLRAGDDAAVARLYELLLKAARFELARRRSAFPHVRGNDLDDLAQQSADDALVSVLGRLDDFRGLSRFTTWAYKFALYEAGNKLRRRAWQGREMPLEPEAWPLVPARDASPAGSAERSELLEEIRAVIHDDLTPHQREVLVATTMSGVPIDVLAERLDTTRGALYKTLHDARHKLRERLAARGFSVEDDGREQP